MEKKEFYLCYVKGNKAYFTSDWENQWGDDWDDAPYEHNAGSPYNSYYKEDKEYPIELKELYYEFPNEWIKEPCDDFCNSPYNVEAINRGDIAWIRGDKFNIQAKTTYEDFIKIVEANKGVVYVKKNDLVNDIINMIEDPKTNIETLEQLMYILNSNKK